MSCSCKGQCSSCTKNSKKQLAEFEILEDHPIPEEYDESLQPLREYIRNQIRIYKQP